ESIAAFVQPNTSSVAQVLRTARDLLEEETGSSSLQGYQDGSQRAALLGGAIYQALRRHRISYVRTPASFERAVQKAGRPVAVLAGLVGNSIALSGTFAACGVQAGLWPFGRMVSGPASAGSCLTESSSNDTVTGVPNEARTLAGSLLARAVVLS